MDINTSFFVEHFNHNVKVKDVVLYPVVNRDLNFKLDSGTNLGEVCAAMKSINQSILQHVSPVDIYESKEEDNIFTIRQPGSEDDEIQKNNENAASNGEPEQNLDDKADSKEDDNEELNFIDAQKHDEPASNQDDPAASKQEAVNQDAKQTVDD